MDDEIQERNRILEELKKQLEKAQLKMKNQADKHRKEVQFEDGDLVYLKLKLYRYQSLAKRPNEKLPPRFYGPYKILERVGKVAYRLELPAIAQILNVFHVSQLKRALKTSVTAHLTKELELQVQPEEIKELRKDNSGKLQLLVKWKDLPDHENTWEDAETIKTQFPQFHLEGKLLLAEGGNVGPPNIWGRVYSRKAKGKTQEQSEQG